jgi:hypothetical protein
MEIVRTGKGVTSVRADPQVAAVYERVLADIEKVLPGAGASGMVRDTVASALTALVATGQLEPEVLRRYAEYHGLAAAQLTPSRES